MRNILLLIKNNLYRLSREKVLLFMIIIMMPIMVGLGIAFGQIEDLKGKIAIVGATAEQKEGIKASLGENNDNISFEFLNDEPTNTDLISGAYVAAINFEGNEPEVKSYGKEDIQKALEASLKGEVYEGNQDTGSVAVKIVGFLTMFLLMGGSQVITFFLEDRKSKVYSRVLSGSVSFFEYITSQIIFCIIILTIPTMIISLTMVKLLEVNLGMSMLSFAGIIALIGLLSSSYGILMCNIFKNEITVEMTASNLSVLTCIVGGCFINIVDTNKVIGFFRNLLPQKRLLDLTANYNASDLIYIIGTIIIFIGISIIVGRKYYKNGEFI